MAVGHVDSIDRKTVPVPSAHIGTVSEETGYTPARHELILVDLEGVIVGRDKGGIRISRLVGVIDAGLDLRLVRPFHLLGLVIDDIAITTIYGWRLG